MINLSYLRFLAFISCLTLTFVATAQPNDLPDVYEELVLRAAEPVSGEYIVMLNPGNAPDPTSAASELRKQHDFEVPSVFRHAIKGFHARNVNYHAAMALARNPWVKQVEEVSVTRTFAQQWVPSDTTNNNSNPDWWGLDRIDQTSPTSPRTDQYFNYCSTGAGVRVYVLDTTVNGTLDEFHDDFGVSRVVTGPDFDGSFGSCSVDNYWTASGGHGTAVASIIAGNEFGVAKRATIVDVKVASCNGTGTTSAIYNALEWIIMDPGRFDQAGQPIPSVINMSLGDARFSTTSCGRPVCHQQPGYVYTIEQLSTVHNIVTIAAAGNGGSDVKNFAGTIFPAGAPEAITVAGINKSSDTRWQYSNYGYNVSIYAPAQYVQSRAHGPSWRTYRSEYSECFTATYPFDGCVSGTSFATPFVTGAVARYIQNNPGASRASILSYLYNEAATGNDELVDNGDGRLLPIVNISDCN